ncbi:PDDEXK nuclease domain-containing protein [Niabella ginsenosidivorans]|uniref:PDDEXK nuclease domain-containing protein n=1 Tax=Niabella ginsenosidivorans TaxID=1176587 RepID=UPI000A02B955|nr:PDDEXK nuclease domain-containing protein [Niabella ginsenosidivorans]
MLSNYKQTLKELKSMILASRYRAAALANKELLLLYFSVGKLIADKAKAEAWGARVLEQVSKDLQKELPGLRGFSATSLKKMRIFYTEWQIVFEFGPLPADQIQNGKKRVKTNSGLKKDKVNPIGPLLTGQFRTAFFAIGFTHHYEILAKAKTMEERVFYIVKAATEFLSIENLNNCIQSNTFKKQGKFLNNFSQTIVSENLREKALLAFKDEYPFDFMNVAEADEQEFENEVVRNIRKFILSIGSDFAFIGNQYRLVVDEEGCFVDLLFFNRKLQSHVAFELKREKFKPEYLGKMNFYLSALDDMVKQPHENPSVGIILCKSKTDKVVGFSFRDFNKAMGVATYKRSWGLPAKYKGSCRLPGH